VVERQLPKLYVAGSIPAARSNILCVQMLDQFTQYLDSYPFASPAVLSIAHQSSILGLRSRAPWTT
jgi:hypothetical protein